MSDLCGCEYLKWQAFVYVQHAKQQQEKICIPFIRLLLLLKCFVNDYLMLSARVSHILWIFEYFFAYSITYQFVISSVKLCPNETKHFFVSQKISSFKWIIQLKLSVVLVVRNRSLHHSFCLDWMDLTEAWIVLQVPLSSLYNLISITRHVLCGFYLFGCPIFQRMAWMYHHRLACFALVDAMPIYGIRTVGMR